MAKPSQAIVRTVPQYMLTLPLTTPIRKGDGKSPKRCMKKIETATACGLSSSSTLDIRPMFAGPTPLSKILQEQKEFTNSHHSQKENKRPDINRIS